MIEMLLQIPGPTFLLYFIGLSIICIVLGRLWVNADGSTQYPLPELTRFDSVTIAALRGSWTSVIRTAVFSLWSRDLIEIKGEGRDTEIKSVLALGKTSGPIEEEIFQFLQYTRKPHDLFIGEKRYVSKLEFNEKDDFEIIKETSLLSRIRQHLENIYSELEQLYLIRSGSDRSRAWMITMLMFFVIGSVGGAKLYLGITHNRPAGFLAVLLIISLIVLLVILKPWSILTKLGRNYIKALEEHFLWLKESVKLERIPEGIDPAFYIAIFGVGILAGTSLYGLFGKAFPSSKARGGFFGGGCGCFFVGGCGGGGCGGGGCGGGGCGGCGGGGFL